MILINSDGHLSVDLGVGLNKTNMISTSNNEISVAVCDVRFGARSGGYTQKRILMKRNCMKLRLNGA